MPAWDENVSMDKTTDWKKIKAEYIQGTSYRKLAEKYGVSFNSVLSRMRKEKWTDLRNQKKSKTDAKIVESIADQEARRAVNLYDAADELLKKMARQMAEAEYIEPAELNAYMTALEKYKRITDVKSRADMDEQRARIDKLRKEAQVEETNKDINVVISDGLKEYSV